MRLVVDANVLFSFFKSDSKVRELILDPKLKHNLELFAPELIIKEIGKHKEEICSKFGLLPDNFDIMFSSLPLFVKSVEKKVFEQFTPKATEILSGHKKDVSYVALALWFKNSGCGIGIWSNEKRLKSLQEYGIKVYNVTELLKKFGLI